MAFNFVLRQAVEDLCLHQLPFVGVFSWLVARLVGWLWGEFLAGFLKIGFLCCGGVLGVVSGVVGRGLPRGGSGVCLSLVVVSGLGVGWGGA